MSKEILIYDNYLDSESFLTLKNEILSGKFSWYFMPFIDYAPDDEEEDFVDHLNNFQFIHHFYLYHGFVSSYSHLLDPILKKINPTALVRIKANLLTRTEQVITNEFHVDSPFKKSKVAIFYINSNNGKTIFKTGQEIDSVENRLVIFDCDLVHTGTTCTDEKVRCVINFNYYKEDVN